MNMISDMAARGSRTPANILALALAAAQAAAIAEDVQLGPEQSRGFDCGFAWVTITPARGEFVKYLKSINFGRSGGYEGANRGYGIWYSKLHHVNTQSVSVHQAAAREFSRVLSDHGISCHTGSRLD